MEKIAFFAFRGDSTCFVHVMLNALDYHAKNIDVKVILEGEAVGMIKEMREKGNKLFEQLEDKDLIDGVCRGCSATLGFLDYNEMSGIRLLDDMNGHPAMSSYSNRGYTIITL